MAKRKTAPADAPVSERWAVLHPNGIYLRVGASRTAEPLLVIPSGEVVAVGADRVDEVWAPVTYGAASGWADVTNLAKLEE